MSPDVHSARIVVRFWTVRRAENSARFSSFALAPSMPVDDELVALFPD